MTILLSGISSDECFENRTQIQYGIWRSSPKAKVLSSPSVRVFL